ncbi:metallophosphoesterase family protein [Thermobifida cellulosilytica]|uniref:Metallophosphoesterase n=1 Tax=Thermobifida cellulosilytica TB100 TaxID=665004 RepID=A0A147KCZ0_THECS|nr:DNA repair exonuclease [Thermobifida cellulosilytica]KUP95138.1 metallophosphoesterase [Thermobifida cellulosilytica TB100]
MKLLHAADLHVDSPLRGLSRYEGAPAEQLRGATRRALENLVDLALAEEVTAVLLAGDVYDGDWPDYNTGLFFARQMGRLHDADIPVYLIAGNHDAQNSMTRTLTLSLPGNVHYFPTDRPDTAVDERRGLAVHGQGFARRDVRDNLAAHYPEPRSGLFNVGLLHTALSGREGHEPYAPCSVDQLVDHGYEYWALGHVHQRRVEYDADVKVVFPGNIQGRHANEAGAKGCTLVTVDGRHRVADLRHHDLDTAARWHDLRVDVRAARDLPDVFRAVTEQLDKELAADTEPDRVHAVRVTVEGPTDAHEQLHRDQESLLHELRSHAAQRADTWVEKLRVKTSPPEEHLDAAHADELVRDLRQTAQRLGTSPREVSEIVESAELLAKLPPRVRDELRDPSLQRDLLAEAVELLAAELGSPR